MKHGANIYKYAKKLDVKPSKMIDFSSNINFFKSRVDITPHKNMLVKYADANYTKLKKSIANTYEIRAKEIALFNGATSAIYTLLQELSTKRVYLYAPLYSEYENSLQSDVEVIKIDRYKELHKKPKKNSLVIFVNPSTPDGKYYDLEALFKLWKRQKCTVILDESFLEFQKLKSLRNQINLYKKLYIIQSFSKFYSCAGVRIGAVFSHKKNIKRLKTPLWHLSSFDTEFLRKRVADKDFKKRAKKLHKKQKNELFKILKESRLFKKIYRSDTNFFMTKSKNSTKIFRALLERKILVRRCESFDFLSKEYLRFAVKNSTSHNKLKKAFDEIC